MEERQETVTEELMAIEQPAFEVRNFRENRPTYAIGGALVWKTSQREKKHIL